LNGILENLLFANNDNLLGGNKYNFCEGNERGALLVTGNESSLVVNAKVKVGEIHNTEGWVNKCFGCLNNW
jgi:hypothetical protein